MQKSNFIVTLVLNCNFFFHTVNISLLYCGLVLSSSRQSHPPPIFFLIQDSILSWLHRLRSLWQKNRKLINAALSPSLHLEARVPVMLPPLFLWDPCQPWNSSHRDALQHPEGLSPVCCVSVPGHTCDTARTSQWEPPCSGAYSIVFLDAKIKRGRKESQGDKKQKKTKQRTVSVFAMALCHHICFIFFSNFCCRESWCFWIHYGPMWRGKVTT